MQDIEAIALLQTTPNDSRLIVYLCNTNDGVVFHLSPAGLDHPEAVCGDDDERSEGNWVPSVFDGTEPRVCEKCRRFRLMERLAE